MVYFVFLLGSLFLAALMSMFLPLESYPTTKYVILAVLTIGVFSGWILTVR